MFEREQDARAAARINKDQVRDAMSRLFAADKIHLKTDGNLQPGSKSAEPPMSAFGGKADIGQPILPRCTMLLMS